MANQERDTFGHNEHFDIKALEQAGSKQQEMIRERIERGQEQERTTAESARAEALDQASSHEKEHRKEVETRATPERRQAITKKEKEQSFNATMQEVRSQLSPASRAFSKVIHQPSIEKASELVGNTIARPNAILSGSLFAFLFTASLYLIARFNGYPLSGTETIASFVLGWLVGLIIDYIRLLFVGKR